MKRQYAFLPDGRSVEEVLESSGREIILGAGVEDSLLRTLSPHKVAAMVSFFIPPREALNEDGNISPHRLILECGKIHKRPAPLDVLAKINKENLELGDTDPHATVIGAQVVIFDRKPNIGRRVVIGGAAYTRDLLFAVIDLPLQGACRHDHFLSYN